MKCKVFFACKAFPNTVGHSGYVRTMQRHYITVLQVTTNYGAIKTGSSKKLVTCRKCLISYRGRRNVVWLIWWS